MVIGVTVALVRAQVALGLSGPQVNAIAQEITVRIDGQNTGSGVIINRQGNTYFVLTNWHVVKEVGKYIIQMSDGTKYSVNLSELRRLPDLDLAVLKFTSSHNYHTADVGNSEQLTEGTRIYVSGWADPEPLIPERSYQFLTGYISSRLQKPNEGYSLVYTVNAVPGMSGGAVLDENGHLVGINGRAIIDVRTGTVSFVLGIGINYYLAATNSLPSPGGSSSSSIAVDFFRRGVDKAERGDYIGALADYTQAIHLNPNYAQAYNNRGLAHSKQGDFAAAIADYDRAIINDPNFAVAYNNRGLAHFSEGNFLGAIADYDRALGKDPTLAEAFNNRGLARSKQFDITGAIADYSRAIVLNPNLAAAYGNRGVARRLLGDFQGASADFQQAANLFLQQGNTDDYQRVLDAIDKHSH